MWTQYALRPAARFMLRHTPRGLRRKSLFTLLSVLVASASSAVVAAMLMTDHHVTAGIVALIGWPLACALDCIDGEIARQDGKTSLAGAVLDAIADIGSFAAVGTALLVWLHTSHERGLPVELAAALLAGVVLWTSGPLGTVGFRASGEVAVQGKSVGALRNSALRRILGTAATLFDWSLIQVGIAVLIIWAPRFATEVAALYLLATGLVLFVTRMITFGRLDEWR